MKNNHVPSALSGDTAIKSWRVLAVAEIEY